MKTSHAYHIRLNFQELFNQPPEIAETFLKKWYFWATQSRLGPMKDAAYTIKRHWDGVRQWFKSQLNNGILEGINSLSVNVHFYHTTSVVNGRERTDKARGV